MLRYFLILAGVSIAWETAWPVSSHWKLAELVRWGRAAHPWQPSAGRQNLSKGTAQRAFHSLPKNDLRYVSATAAD